ncbi:PucR family transcriptional regulator [Intestinimonas butyriciproducens]|uniref:PucR family transcriptional regulator n=1 Tax=Intestinimonas butyriciproducens TaxID=1297617 RepID=UPI00195D8E04|nr:helix-turn-helix domain-containing protein [Intestinimonas butyriciproducens]MBM6918630.1 helix-turn-helix domain-containing protein [Intestinimonas butyriciproducens]
MAARLFQSILLEVKDNVDFILGVVDNTGVITACTELKFIGESIEAAVEFFKMGLEEGQVGGYTFHMIGGYEAGAENAVFAGSIGERATLVCALTAVAIKNSKTQYDEKHDKVTFIKKIILDNILPGDIYIKSREMHFVSDCKRVAYSVRMEDRQDAAVMEALVKLFPDRQKDFVITISESEIALIKELKNGDAREVSRIAEQMDKALDEEVGIPHVIGIGSVVGQLKDIARSFKEAQIAVDVGHVFNEDKTVMNFENLGIGRLIYQLPTTLCEMFLSEVFKKGSIDSLDEETLFTIQKFFENNLNVSETSRKLFVHRNTLVYRLEKIKKLTGLDLREFDNAIVLKVALMVKQYLRSRETMA